MWVAFANAKATHIFSAKILAVFNAVFNDQSLNDVLIDDIVSFERLGPGDFNLPRYWYFFISAQKQMLWAPIRSALLRLFL